MNSRTFNETNGCSKRHTFAAGLKMKEKADVLFFKIKSMITKKSMMKQMMTVICSNTGSLRQRLSCNPSRNIR